jgi:predicted N-formylglutamate amidohydrolase
MRRELPSSIPGVADVELLRGPAAAAGAAIDLLVEVPHGAARDDYDALRAALRGPLPDDLHEFFAVNTDVGAWDLGRAAAARVVAEEARRTALVVRCRIPRTFIDCNRVEEATEDQLASGGMTASVPAYVRDAGDRARLLGLHRAYVGLVEAAHAALAPQGFVLLPHTYGPRTLGIDRVDDDIVAKLRWAHEPGRVEGWPLRPEIDVISRSGEGDVALDRGVVEEIAAAYRALGLDVRENATYHLHPSTLGYRWAVKFPGRLFCLEVRRDLLVRRWVWNGENEVLEDAVQRLAGPLAEVIGRRL